VPLALGFLAGELTYPQDLDQQQERDQELVPYLENKGRGVYAWIGAGRDSDTLLQDLCTKFLAYKYVSQIGRMLNSKYLFELLILNLILIINRIEVVKLARRLITSYFVAN